MAYIPSITVKTKPVKGKVTIWRVNPNGMMSMGPAPQSASRVYPWPFAIGLEPVISNGDVWVPEKTQERGLLLKDEVRVYKYFKVRR